MFVSVALDPGSEERARELADLLTRYGLEKVQRGLWESAMMSAASLEKMKRDIDRATDAYDRVRIYQYPVDGVLVVSGMRENKWRRLVARVPASLPDGRKPDKSGR